MRLTKRHHMAIPRACDVMQPNISRAEFTELGKRTNKINCINGDYTWTDAEFCTLRCLIIDRRGQLKKQRDQLRVKRHRQDGQIIRTMEISSNLSFGSVAIGEKLFLIIEQFLASFCRELLILG
jgi:hypothetical protein